MSNYLQKIAVSGARTTSSVKHPALSHAVMPPVYPMPHASMSEYSEHDEPLQMASNQAVVPEPRMASPVAPADKQPEVMPAINSSLSRGYLHREALPVTPVPHSSSVTVQAPRGLRRTLYANDTKPIGVTLGNVPPEAAYEHGTFSEASERAPRRLTESEALQDPQPVVKQGETIPVISYPASPILDPSAVRVVVPPQAVPDRLLSKAILTDSGMKRVVRPPSIPKQIDNAPDAAVQPASPRKPALISGAMHQDRRGRISIGRIDVQVNNQLAPQPPSPQRAKQTARTNVLDARYLNRFFLRP